VNKKRKGNPLALWPRGKHNRPAKVVAIILGGKKNMGAV